MLRRLTHLVLILLALQLPFELERAWLTLGPLVLTNVELLLWLALPLALLTWWHAGRPDLPVPRSWLAAGLIFLGALTLSALLAPDFRLNALKAALRTAGGMLLALAVAVTLQIPQRDHAQRLVVWLAVALVAGGTVAATLGLAEVVYGTDFEWLAPLRVAATVAGPFLRLSGPFDYANQASMYFEATLPLLLALIWVAWQAERRVLAILAGMTFIFYVESTVYTFSRAGFVTMTLALGIIPLLQWRRGRGLSGRQGTREALPSLFAGGAVLIVLLIAANVLLNQNFRLRFQSEGDNDWYLAHFRVPAELTFTAGQEKIVPVTVTNEGAFTWRTAGNTPVNLAARWIQPDGGRELSWRPRWPLGKPVAPGESLTMEVPVRAPRQGGQYRLVWDMVQEYVVWFGAKTGQETATSVTVVGTVPGGETTGEETPETFEAEWVYAAPVPGRLTLWRAAWQLWRAHPLVGIGLDNYRLLYGRPLEYGSWNTSIHSNSLYVETLVGAGLLGTLPFFLLLVGLAWDGLRVLRRPDASVWQAAVAAGILAYFVHGVLDYFLLFHATGLLFWLLVGLWLTVRSPGGQAS